MKKGKFLICYDISDKKRLAKVARSLEKVSIRIQKSIFYYLDASKNDIINLIDILNNIIDKQLDDVRIYKINIDNSLHLKSAINLSRAEIMGV